MRRSRGSFASGNQIIGSAAAALALALGVLGYRAWGEAPGSSLPLGAPGAAAPAPIMAGPQKLFAVDGLPGQTAAGRAAAINRRIASFVRNPEQIAPVVVQIRGPERVLAVARREIVTVTPQDAADNLTTVPELADDWRRELDQALSAVAAEHQTLWIQIRDSIVLSADELLREAAALIPRLLSALLVLFIARFAARSVRTGVQRLLLRTHPDLNTQQLIRTLTYYGVWTLGWVLALGTAGIHPTALVAGLGVTTIVLGFALKDLLSNLVSGFLILTTRPFSLGDQIAVKELEGTVERIELRATHLRAFDNRLIIIPNTDLYIATITNNTASPYRRHEFIVGIDYAADLSQAAALAQRVALETPDVLPDPAPDVLVHELASSSVNLKVRFHTDPRRSNAVIVGSQVKQRVKEAFGAAGIAIYPPSTQIVQLQDGEEPPSTTNASRSDTGKARARPAPATRSEHPSPLPTGRARPRSAEEAEEEGPGAAEPPDSDGEKGAG